jgi:predicted HTH transcriptional regulator
MNIMPEQQEYKSVWKDEYLKWICSFANANGGTLYIGKDDSGSTKQEQRRSIRQVSVAKNMAKNEPA